MEWRIVRRSWQPSTQRGARGTHYTVCVTRSRAQSLGRSPRFVGASVLFPAASSVSKKTTLLRVQCLATAEEGPRLPGEKVKSWRASRKATTSARKRANASARVTWSMGVIQRSREISQAFKKTCFGERSKSTGR